MYAQNEKYRRVLGLGYHIPYFRVMMLFLILAHARIKRGFLIILSAECKAVSPSLGSIPLCIKVWNVLQAFCQHPSCVVPVFCRCLLWIIHALISAQREIDKKTSSKKLTAYLRADPQRATLKN